MVKKKAPCKGCQDRHVGCHGKCDRYLAFRKEADRLREERLVQRKISDYITEADSKRSYTERRQP